MSKKALRISAEEAEINALSQEYKAHIEGLQKAWLRENNHRPKHHTLYELDPREQERVDFVIKRWSEYITPIAEAWWKERGFGIIWPKGSSQPCQIFKLEAAVA